MPTFEGVITELRNKIKEVAKDVLSLKNSESKSEARENEDKGEVLANLMLSYRHLEDGSMRLGKVLQALNGGKSVYDGKEDNSVVGSPDKAEDEKEG